MNTKHKNKRESKTDSRFITCNHLDKIGEIAVYYGFTPMKRPAVTKVDTSLVTDVVDMGIPLGIEEKIALVRNYHEQNMHNLSQPVMCYFKDPSHPTKKNAPPRYADLEMLGTSGSIAEATLIQTTRAILSEEGYTKTSVEINSVGDRESMSRFSRELIAYYRKNINTMSPEARQLFKKDPFLLLSSKDKSYEKLNQGAPRSMDFLSETSRRHLEEVLEYLEALDIPYTINNGLVGNRTQYTEMIFTIVDVIDTENKSKDPQILAVGVRYNGLSRRLNMKRDINTVGVSILINNGKNDNRKPLTKVKRPIFSFVQLGLESKLISLDIIERLRKVKIPLNISLSKDRLGAQVSSVEKFHAPYVIVMGKKEAMDQTAIVRRIDTYSQSIVPLNELPSHMKKLEEQYFKRTSR
jgi:histidyl-tRNA synthetase